MASSAWEKRNAKARAAGYRNYYDYRVHNYGKRPARETVGQAEREKYQGKRGPAQLRRALKTPDRIALIIELPASYRGSTGEVEVMRYNVTFTDGDIREYLIPLDEEGGDYDLEYWHKEFEDADVDWIKYGKASE